VTEPLSYVAEPLSRAFDEAMDECELARKRGGLAGISTGFKDIDSKTSGMLPGQLWTIGAQTGGGKSALALCIARNVVADIKAEKHPQDVYFASLEMGRVPLVHRLAAIRSGLDLLKIISWDLTPNQMQAYMNAMGHERLGAEYIHTDDRARLTLADMRAQLERLAHGNLSLAVIDYLQLVTPSVRQGMREREVAEAARGLKELAMHFKIPIIGCSQLSRGADHAEEPSLNHLRESGEIEHASDVVILIGPADGGVVSMKIAKARNGKRGKFELAWAPQCTRFSDLSRREDPASPPSRQGRAGYD